MINTGFSKKKKDSAKFNSEKIFSVATQEVSAAYFYLNTSHEGLTQQEAERRLQQFGKNEVSTERQISWYVMLLKTFLNPFIGILMCLAIISYVMDVLMAAPNDRDWMSVIIIAGIVLLSVTLRFSQEWRSNKASQALKKMIISFITPY